MTLPDWIGRVLRASTAALVLVFACFAIFAAVVMPYRLWDSLAFGSWSRSIAVTGDLWSNASTALLLQRPLFYVEQGLAWHVLGGDEWIGRLLSLSFAALLAVSVWVLARRLSPTADGQALLPPLAIGVVLGSSVLATYVAAGMSDVPVAALVAATAAALWSDRPSHRRLALIALLGAAAVLAKPTAMLAFAGLAPAALLLFGRRAPRGLGALGVGIAVALLYDLWQSTRIDVGFADFLTAGNDEFWRERGAAARWDALARAEWFGSSLRLLVVFGLVHAVARAFGARPRLALGIGACSTIVWSVAGPVVADGSVGYPYNGSIVGVTAWLVLSAAMLAATLLARDDPVGRRTYAALLLWLTPTAVAWAWQRADEVRHLAPAWAPIALLTAAALASVSLALIRLRPAAVLAPGVALALLVLANIPAIDGLGRDGWRGLLELGPSGWSNRSELENYAYGPFSYELDLARENVGAAGRIVSSNGRLTYFFPGRVDVGYPRACAELDGARFFSLLTAGESLEFARREGQPTEPLAWIQCTNPHVELVGKQEGIYAAFVVGGPPTRTPLASDCGIEGAAGQDVDAVLGDELGYADARLLRGRGEAVGFRGLRIEQTGCSEFRVVITGVPTDTKVQADLQHEIEGVGLDVAFEEAVRYPEVPDDVPAVR